jgi:integrase
MTFRALSEKFMAEYRGSRVKDPERYRRRTKSIFKVRVWPTLGDRRAASITADDIETLRDAMGKKPRTVNNTLAAISKMYEWARKKKYTTAANPASKLDRLNPGPSSLEYFSKEHVAKLLAHAQKRWPLLYPAIATGVMTGLRKGELAGLRWQDVRLDAAQLDVMRSYTTAPKSGRERHVPIHPDLVVILRQWKKECPKTDEGLVFPDDGKMWGEWDTRKVELVMRGAHVKLPKKPWHALRHTFASHFMMAGGNILTLKELLGHSTVQMTMIYAHLAPDFKAAEVARMSFAQPIAGVADMAEARRAAIAT